MAQTFKREGKIIKIGYKKLQVQGIWWYWDKKKRKINKVKKLTEIKESRNGNEHMQTKRTRTGKERMY